MKVADASSARIWGLERHQPRAGAEASREARLHRGVADRLADMYSTVTPRDSDYYAAGRRTLDTYARSFVDIREYTYSNSVNLRSARMTDAQIESLIQRMNLSHR
jgi:hypothetical protein